MDRETVTVEEALRQKRRLEKELKAACERYEQETRLVISEIEIVRIEIEAPTSQFVEAPIAEIHISVEFPRSSF